MLICQYEMNMLLRKMFTSYPTKPVQTEVYFHHRYWSSFNLCVHSSACPSIEFPTGYDFSRIYPKR